MNFLIWSPLISLSAITLLYPLRLHSRGSQVARVYAAFLLFPAIVSFVSMLKLTYFDGIFISVIAQIPFGPVFWGIQVSKSNSAIIACINVSMAVLIFLLPKNRFVENISLAAIALGTIFILSTTPDQLIRMSVYSIGTILITYMLLNDEHDKNIILQVTNDFLWQRASDFLAFIALINILINQKTLLLQKLAMPDNNIEISSRILFFVAIAMRVISLNAVDSNLLSHSDSTIKNSVLRRVFIGAGSQILLLQFSTAIFGNILIDRFFLISSICILFYALILLIFDYDKTKFADHLASIFTAGAFVAICAGANITATALICGLLIIYPVISLSTIVKTTVLLNTRPPSKLRRSVLWASFLEWTLLRLPIKLSYFFASVFTNVLNPIYAGFFLYRMPQILIGIVQTPLRLVHNGNIQRSLVFVAILAIAYIYRWGP